MLVKLRYVTKRVDRSGGERWYWQRRGHPLTRLPDNPIERMAMAERLNAAADNLAPVELERSTIGWVIQRYRGSDEYQALAAGTLKYYNRFLRDIEALGPALPFASFTRRVVVDLIESYEKMHQRQPAAAVLQNLYKLAQYHGIVATNEAARLRLKTNKPRDRIWSDGEIAGWIDAAASESHMVTGFLLLQFTAQRPSDVLRMTWPQYSGTAIRLRQQKTGALLDVPVHPVLRDRLDGMARSPTTLTIVAHRGGRCTTTPSMNTSGASPSAPASMPRRETYAEPRCFVWRRPAPQCRRSPPSRVILSTRHKGSWRPIYPGTAPSPRSRSPRWLSTNSGQKSNALDKSSV